VAQNVFYCSGEITTTAARDLTDPVSGTSLVFISPLCGRAFENCQLLVRSGPICEAASRDQARFFDLHLHNGIYFRHGDISQVNDRDSTVVLFPDRSEQSPKARKSGLKC
jgi:hypothetical protein